ncbi:hypothetical protein GCM10009850_096070 [Nonomuraea monospora]|uniref:Transcriptional regulator n=1 Tax=Nonomuraea monospora TaxID=568818 RepID=A0ABN3CXB4_9ACTN
MANQRKDITNHPLTHIRQERGWTYQDLVNAVAEEAKRMGVRNMAARREKAWRWETWGVEPDLETQYALASVLGVSQNDVRRLEWPTWIPTGMQVRTDTPWNQAGAIHTLEKELEDVMLDRRGFMIIAGSTVSAIAYSWTSIEPERVAAALNGRVIDEEIVTWIENRIPSLRRMDDKLGGAKLRDLVGAELHLVSELLANGTYTSRVGRRLFDAAGELGQLAGWVSFDTGLNAAAQRYYLAALRAAHAADNRPLAANIVACMSFQSVIVGDPRDGVTLAQSAVSAGGRSATPRVRSFLATREASAYARAGDAAACQRALSRADAELDRADKVDKADDPAWIYYFDEAELIAQAGACYLNLDMLKKADSELEIALANQDPSYVRDRILYQTRRATTQFRLGNLDHACTLATEAAALTRKARSRRSTQAVRDFRLLLASAETEPLVRELDSYIAALG